jgi:predicted transcriptional regulator of viral defense system
MNLTSGKTHQLNTKALLWFFLLIKTTAFVIMCRIIYQGIKIMTDLKHKEIINIFNQNNGFANTKNFIENRIHNVYLKELIEKNEIVKVKRGLYKLSTVNISNELSDVSRILPKGIICLGSALSYYELTTYNPIEYHVAIYRKDKVILPDYPPIKLFYFSEKEYKTGISEIKDNEITIKIYDMEKTICDCIRYRNKIGIDIMKESLNNYLSKKEKDITKLFKYAEILRISKIVKQYLDVLI